MRKTSILSDHIHTILKKPKTCDSASLSSLVVNTRAISDFVQRTGNRLFRHLLVQLYEEKRGGTLDDDTVFRIDYERNAGHPLEGSVKAKMSQIMKTDFSNIRTHTNHESDALNRQLNAKAFTSGQDIFFREGEYQPNTTEGQQLIAHELTHVVQQDSGAVGGGSGKMTVNPPGDRFEQEADAVAKEVVSAINSPQVQRQVPEEDEELQTKALQRQAIPEEEDEEILQRQEIEEDEEELNA